MRLVHTAGLVLSLLLISYSLQGQATTGTTPPNQTPVPLSGSVLRNPPLDSSLRPPWVPNPVRDEKATQEIQTALTALGGTAAIALVQSCTVQGQMQLYSPSQNKTGNFELRVAGGQFRGDYSDSSSTSTLSSGNGTPFFNTNGTMKAATSQYIAAYVTPQVIATVLYSEFQDSNHSFQYLGTGTIGSESVVMVRTSSQSSRSSAVVTPQTWYFDASTGLPVQVDYRIPDLRRADWLTPATVTLSNYQSIAGVLYPFQAAKSILGKQVEVTTTSSVEPNTPIATSVFDGGVQ